MIKTLGRSAVFIFIFIYSLILLNLGGSMSQDAPTIIFETNQGNIEIELFPHKA